MRDIDTLLLDIKMAELNSIDIARNIRKVDNNIYNISNKLCTGKIWSKSLLILIKANKFSRTRKTHINIYQKNWKK